MGTPRLLVIISLPLDQNLGRLKQLKGARKPIFHLPFPITGPSFLLGHYLMFIFFFFNQRDIFRNYEVLSGACVTVGGGRVSLVFPGFAGLEVGVR